MAARCDTITHVGNLSTWVVIQCLTALGGRDIPLQDGRDSEVLRLFVNLIDGSCITHRELGLPRTASGAATPMVYARMRLERASG